MRLGSIPCKTVKNGLKIRRASARGGSTPPPGTRNKQFRCIWPLEIQKSLMAVLAAARFLAVPPLAVCRGAPFGGLPRDSSAEQHDHIGASCSWRFAGSYAGCNCFQNENARHVARESSFRRGVRLLLPSSLIGSDHLQARTQ